MRARGLELEGFRVFRFFFEFQSLGVSGFSRARMRLSGRPKGPRAQIVETSAPKIPK